jgi:ABC-2 type transport system ATP-binding protein
MTAVLRADGLGKRYGATWALRDCSLELPEGRVAALIGPNGAGKTTLLSLVMGLTDPTQGSVATDGHPAGSSEALARVAFMGQDHPLYKRFTVADLLRLGRSMNRDFDTRWAAARLDDLGIPRGRTAGKLSGGQQTQVALTLAMAKRARLLLLDEPLASLDPVARRECTAALMARVAETGCTVVFSSHVVAELERVCDHLIVISDSTLQVSSETDVLLATHGRLIGPGEAEPPAGVDAVLERTDSGAQTVLLARLRHPVADPRWESRPVTIEDIALGYLTSGRHRAPAAPATKLTIVPNEGSLR